MGLIDTLCAIGDAIRRKTGRVEQIPLEQMPEVIENLPTIELRLQEKLVTENGTVKPDFWSNGLSAVHVAVKNEDAYNEGRTAEYDRFWDAFQKNGARTNYANGFTGQGFNFSNFYPKYDIVPTSANQMFYAWQTAGDGQTETSLKKRLEECGVRLDISQATTVAQMFQYGYCLTELPTLDFSSVTSGNQVFEGCNKLVTIEKLIVTETVTMTRWFHSCSALENIVFEGVIGAGDLNLSYAKNLTHDSLMSVINALKNFSGTGTTRTATLGNDNLVKLTTEEIAIATEKGWTLL